MPPKKGGRGKKGAAAAPEASEPNQSEALPLSATPTIPFTEADDAVHSPDPLIADPLIAQPGPSAPAFVPVPPSQFSPHSPLVVAPTTEAQYDLGGPAASTLEQAQVDGGSLAGLEEGAKAAFSQALELSRSGLQSLRAWATHNLFTPGHSLRAKWRPLVFLLPILLSTLWLVSQGGGQKPTTQPPSSDAASKEPDADLQILALETLVNKSMSKVADDVQARLEERLASLVKTAVDASALPSAQAAAHSASLPGDDGLRKGFRSRAERISMCGSDLAAPFNAHLVVEEVRTALSEPSDSSLRVLAYPEEVRLHSTSIIYTPPPLTVGRAMWQVLRRLFARGPPKATTAQAYRLLTVPGAAEVRIQSDEQWGAADPRDIYKTCELEVVPLGSCLGLQVPVKRVRHSDPDSSIGDASADPDSPWIQLELPRLNSSIKAVVLFHHPKNPRLARAFYPQDPPISGTSVLASHHAFCWTQVPHSEAGHWSCANVTGQSRSSGFYVAPPPPAAPRPGPVPGGLLRLDFGNALVGSLSPYRRDNMCVYRVAVVVQD